MALASAEAESIAARVRRAWTGNRHRDLLGFALGAEFEAADAEWHTEAMRRYEDAQRAQRYRTG